MAATPRQPSRPTPPSRGSSAYRRAPGLPPVVNGYSVTIISPTNGIKTRDRRPDITVVGTSVLGPVDIQVEWRTAVATQSTPTGPWVPAPTYVSEFLGSVSGSPQVLEPPADLTYFTWYYRARAGDKSSNTWGSWSPQYWLDVYPILGSASEYVDMNIGVVLPIVLDSTVAYLDINVGVEPESPLDELVRYLNINVGVMPQWRVGAEYSEMNVYQPTGPLLSAHYSDINAVSGETPAPHIWWVRPEQGREGYVFNIYGHGFGEFQNQYDGIVKLGNLTCQIVRWEVVARSALSDADLKIIHGMGLDPDQITVEHGWLVAVVPSGAVSSNIRVILEDD